MRVPEDTDADVVVGLELAVQLGALPVPQVHLAVSVAARDVAAQRKRIAMIRMVERRTQDPKDRGSNPARSARTI